MICPGVFFNFKILIFQVVRGLKGQKNGLKWQKFLSVAPYISGTINDLHLWYTCVYKRIISPDIFSYFSKFWFSGSLGGTLKGQKMAQNDKKFCLSRTISQEPYIIWLWFGCTCKMMISTGNFSIFQSFDFWGF